MKVRKKPVVVDAFRWDGASIEALCKWAAHTHANSLRARGEAKPGMQVSLPITIITGNPIRVEMKTIDGNVAHAEPGDWVICGVAGEFYPCKHDIFEQTYEPVAS